MGIILMLGVIIDINDVFVFDVVLYILLFSHVEYFIIFQETRLIIHVVPQSNQIHPLHYLAQLQVDHSQDIIFHISHLVHCPIFLLPARLHNQKDVGSIRPFIHYNILPAL